jgi:hypothetical protein
VLPGGWVSDERRGPLLQLVIVREAQFREGFGAQVSELIDQSPSGDVSDRDDVWPWVSRRGAAAHPVSTRLTWVS